MELFLKSLQNYSIGSYNQIKKNELSTDWKLSVEINGCQTLRPFNYLLLPITLTLAAIPITAIPSNITSTEKNHVAYL